VGGLVEEEGGDRGRGRDNAGSGVVVAGDESGGRGGWFGDEGRAPAVEGGAEERTEHGGWWRLASCPEGGCSRGQSCIVGGYTLICFVNSTAIGARLMAQLAKLSLG